MFYVYILFCKGKKTQKQSYYVGYTDNLERRMKQHKSGKSRYTSSKDVILAYYELHLTQGEAIKREQELKSYSKTAKEGLIRKFDPLSINKE